MLLETVSYFFNKILMFVKSQIQIILYEESFKFFLFFIKLIGGVNLNCFTGNYFSIWCVPFYYRFIFVFIFNKVAS